jgi:outer membrane protein assembly factor BamB
MIMELLYYSDADTSGNPLRVKALDLDSFEIQWEHILEGTEEEDYGFITPAVGMDQVVAGAVNVGKYCGIDRLTGEPIWTHENRITSPILDGSRVYIMNDSCFFCLETATGIVGWSKDISQMSTPAVDDSNVYVIADESMTAFDKWDGTQKW